jgi:hypothetical protein
MQPRTGLLLTLLLFFFMGVQAQTVPTQTIRGKIVDATSGQPVAGAVISLSKSAPPLEAVSGPEGRFRLEKVPAGRHVLNISQTSYKPYFLPDLIVHAGKETVLEIELELRAYDLEEVVINSESYREVERVSTRVFTVEETKRFAAVYFDPARMATSFPGVIQANDQANGLIVRGNSPNGVLWRMEGVDIVNPNHLTNAGTFSDRITQSGGGTIILSTQLLDNSTFSTGAFAPEYGNALAGVFDIRLRGGNDEQYEFTGQAGLIGIDLSAEGPISREASSSFLVNYRYSTVGLLGLMGLSFGGEEIAFQDLAFNLKFPTQKAGTFTLFGMGGLSSNLFTGVRADSLREEQKERFDIDFRSRMGAIGATHSLLLGNRTLWRSAVAASGISSERFGDFIQDNQQLRRVEEDEVTQGKFSVTTSLSHQFNARHDLTVGAFYTEQLYHLESYYTDPFGPGITDTLARVQGSAGIIQPYANWGWQLAPRWSLEAGLHGLFYLLNQTSSLEPRLSLTYEPGMHHRLRLAYGLHSQVQNPGTYFATFAGPDGDVNQPNRDLGLTRAHHFVFNYTYRFNRSLSLQVEPYYQHLFDVPVSTNPGRNFSTLNLLEGYVTDTLANEGQGRNYGLELTLEKVLESDWYYLLTGSLYQSEFRLDESSPWQDTRFNGNYLFSFSGGREWGRVTKKGKNKVFGVNLRAIYQGGFLEQPIDVDASAAANRTVYAPGATYSERLPDYFRLDLRIVFKRNKEHYTRTFGIDIQNALNTQNVAFRAWDFVENEVVTRYQLGLIPLLSYRLEF